MTKNSHKKVKVIGAGFTGLVTSYYLLKYGFSVEIYEKEKKAGGLLGTSESPWGLVESAANGLLWNQDLVTLCEDVEVELLFPKKENKKRYIYREKPRSFPLFLHEVPHLLGAVLRILFYRVHQAPKKKETVKNWGERVLGSSLTSSVLLPALQGIYGAETGDLSASLIFGGYFSSKKSQKEKIKGTVSFQGGMGQFVQALYSYLQRQGVTFFFGSPVDQLQPDELTVVATNVRQAQNLIKDLNPEVTASLKKVQMVSLVSLTAFFEKSPQDLSGFGCLFPQKQGFHSIGVLFNSDIFEKRGLWRSETYIIPGDFINLTDDQLKNKILKDRSRFQKSSTELKGFKVTRWPQALPRYDLHLEDVLPLLKNIHGPLFLNGNYLGKIGLSKILFRSKQLAQDVERFML